jgi:type II secretory pathway pseudopilin PulG
VVLASLSSAREGARDARRLQDMNQIRTALELYYNDNGEYPRNTRQSGNTGFERSNLSNGKFIDPLVDGGYLANYIVDPVNENSNIYYYYYFHKGYRGCPDDGYFLSIRDMETSDDPHPDSPEFDCDGATSVFTSNTEWSTGSYE